MASTIVSRTQSGSESAAGRRTWTFSCWFKRSGLSSSQELFGTDANGARSNNYNIIDFNSSDQLDFSGYESGTTFRKITNRKFRDTNAWYHLVIAFDTTQSTADDRIKIYINGVQETSFGTSTNPAQDHQSKFFSSGKIHAFGRGSQTFDGVISHCHATEGTAYAPTVFGETDSTTGEWKIITNPSVSYGTNGFFLFKNDNAVTNQAGNSSGNFAVTAGTLTKTEDCPSNIFCTVNPVFAHNISGAYTPNLVQGNTTWYPSSNSGHSWGRSTLGWTSGKYYMEFKVEEANGGQSSGVWMVPTELPQNISPQTPSDTTYGWQIQYSNTNQNFYTTNGGSTVSTITTSVGSNPIVMMAIDADNNKMWIGHNGTWYNNNNASTTLNNSYPDHTWTPGTYGDMYQLSFQSYYSSSNYNNNRANFGNGYFGTTAVSSAGTNASNNGIFEYDVPTGFTALSTKGLNL